MANFCQPILRRKIFMKKVLSLALALAMVLSLGVVALADENGEEGVLAGFDNEVLNVEDEDEKDEDEKDEDEKDEDEDEVKEEEYEEEYEDDGSLWDLDLDNLLTGPTTGGGWVNSVDIGGGYAGIVATTWQPPFFAAGNFLAGPAAGVTTITWDNGAAWVGAGTFSPIAGQGAVQNISTAAHATNTDYINFQVQLSENNSGFIREIAIPATALNPRTVAPNAATAVTIWQRPHGASWVPTGTNFTAPAQSVLGNPITTTQLEVLAGFIPGSVTATVDFTHAALANQLDFGNHTLALRPTPAVGAVTAVNQPGLRAVPTPATPVQNWFTVTGARVLDGTDNAARQVVVDFQIGAGAPTVATTVYAAFGGNTLVIPINLGFDELNRTIFAGRTQNNRHQFVGSFTYGGTGASLARWNALPVGTVLSISNIADLNGLNPRTATGTLRIDGGVGTATRTVTITLHTVAGTGVVFPAHFTLNRTQPGVPNEVFFTNSTNPQLRVVPNAVAQVVPTQGQVPNNWRVDGISASGELRIQLYLSRLLNMTGDDVHRITVIPSDFTWRIPNTAIPGMTGGGFQTEQNWEVRANQLLGEAGSIPATLLNEPFALRSVHFERTSLRTTRTVNMSGTIRDVEWHWGSQNMAIRVRTPEFMARTGTTTVEFDLNMAVTGASNRLVGRATLDVANERVYVYENQEFIDPSRTEYLRAEDTIRQIDIYAGEGVTFRRNITRGQSIYVQAEMATHDAWDELFRNHAELVDIIVIHHAGMAHAASAVTIDRPNTYFVYDAERRLIGTTADNDLPFSGIYFLTTAQIDIGGATLPEDPAGAAPELQDPNVPVTGGDGGASNNVNLNPGTGR